MSKLNVDQKSVKDLFQNNKADFLIPDYQRPYAWEGYRPKKCVYKKKKFLLSFYI